MLFNGIFQWAKNSDRNKELEKIGKAKFLWAILNSLIVVFIFLFVFNATSFIFKSLLSSIKSTTPYYNNYDNSDRLYGIDASTSIK
ncbi:MAG: hypothetical protein LBD88_01230 [Candidatus Peribacteria bacterium]|nr:hypothetical protein [Candidatus Peribacteria bacterium]